MPKDTHIAQGFFHTHNLFHTALRGHDTGEELAVVAARVQGSDKPTNAGLRDKREAFRGSNHLVEQRMHEIQRPSKLAAGEVTFPNFQGDAFGGVPGVGAEAVGTGESLHPKACLRQ